MVQDSPSRHQDQFVLRMPDGMRERIMETAKSNNRSMNSEIVAILEKAFLPSLSVRLQTLLDQVNSARNPTLLTPSKVAELIGEPQAGAVEGAFAGKGGLTFSQIDSIARLWGARADWLKHGTGTMFPVQSGHGFGVEAAHRFRQSKAEKILFLRSKSKYGELAVAIEHKNGEFETILTGIQLCEHVGPGSEAESALFSNACRYLWKECKHRMSGYLLEDDAYTSLIHGGVYPGLALNRLSYSAWIEDWWDERQLSKSKPDEYWVGYKSFCERIYKYVETDKFLRNERDAILAGTWKLREK
jgi:hypothetical protein